MVRSGINRTTHGVLTMSYLILKAADVTFLKGIVWGLSSTQYGSIRSSSFTSCVPPLALDEINSRPIA